MRETNRDKQVNELYERLLEELKAEVQPKLFDTIFAGDSFSLKSLEGNRATFTADSESSAAIIRASYTNLLKNKLGDLLHTPVDVEIMDKNSFARRKEQIAQTSATFFQNSHLQRNFTFENFVIGSNNRDAFLAANFAVENPARSNPIFLYSKSGLGKTHLLQAIGNAYSNKYPEYNVLYITSDDFVSEFIKYVKGNKDSENLKDFFSTIDMLLVDDIQFLAGKEETQIMFFNVFNLLVSRGKQIVLTSDRAPSELKGLQDRLVSRFAGGLTISISSPNKDTLVEILKMKIQTTGLSLDLFEEEVLEYLAFNYSKNVRELEGAFTRLLFAITTHRPQGKITLSFAKEVFEDDEKRREKKSKIDVDSIIKAVADYFSLTEAQIKSKVRTSQIALARQIAMYLCRSILSTPYQEIGRQFGKDHTTVLANVSKIQSSLNTDASLKKAMDELTKRIKDHK